MVKQRISISGITKELLDGKREDNCLVVKQKKLEYGKTKE